MALLQSAPNVYKAIPDPFTTTVVNSPIGSELLRVTEGEALAKSKRFTSITHFGLVLWRN